MDTIIKQPFSQRAKAFLQEVLAFNRALEEVLVDILAAISPWLAPVAPAYLAWRHMTEILQFDHVIAIITAMVVEFLGLATVSTTFSLWDYNDTRRAEDQRAPMWVAGMTAGAYIAIILTVNVLLDSGPGINKLAQALLSLLSVIGAVTLAIRAQHARRLAGIKAQQVAAAAEQERRQEKDEAKEERKAAAEERKAERELRKAEIELRKAELEVRKLSGKATEATEPSVEILESASEHSGKSPEGRRKVADWRDLTVEEKLVLSGKSPKEIAELYPVTDRTARTWKDRLNQNGFHRNDVEV